MKNCKTAITDGIAQRQLWHNASQKEIQTGVCTDIANCNCEGRKERQRQRGTERKKVTAYEIDIGWIEVWFMSSWVMTCMERKISALCPFYIQSCESDCGEETCLEFFHRAGVLRVLNG